MPKPRKKKPTQKTPASQTDNDLRGEGEASAPEPAQEKRPTASEEAGAGGSVEEGDAAAGAGGGEAGEDEAVEKAPHGEDNNSLLPLSLTAVNELDVLYPQFLMVSLLNRIYAHYFSAREDVSEIRKTKLDLAQALVQEALKPPLRSIEQLPKYLRNMHDRLSRIAREGEERSQRAGVGIGNFQTFCLTARELLNRFEQERQTEYCQEQLHAAHDSFSEEVQAFYGLGCQTLTETRDLPLSLLTHRLYHDYVLTCFVDNTWHKYAISGLQQSAEAKLGGFLGDNGQKADLKSGLILDQIADLIKQQRRFGESWDKDYALERCQAAIELLIARNDRIEREHPTWAGTAKTVANRASELGGSLWQSGATMFGLIKLATAAGAAEPTVDEEKGAVEAKETESPAAPSRPHLSEVARTLQDELPSLCSTRATP